MTKAQVLALFLSTASAATISELINGNCSASTVAAGTPTSALTQCSSLTTCTNDAGCTGTANEKCGTFRTINEDNNAYKCVYTRACDNVGKAAGSKFYVHCFNGADGESADSTGQLFWARTADSMFNEVAAVVGTDGTSTFTSIQDVKIPSIDNFQTGWWTVADGVYSETDKPVNNKCQSNTDCTTAGQCCANWPDTNNKRCIDATKGGVEQTLLPMASFTPVCAASGNAAPISAKDDLADEAAAQAAQAVTDFESLMKETAKTEEKYAEMTDEKKTAWTADWDAEAAKAKAYIAKDKTNSGYDVFTTEQKTVYDAELLKWMQGVFEKCAANKKSIECQDANKIRDKETTARLDNEYYTKNSEERTTLDLTQADANKAEVAALTAAWIETNKPAKGAVGSGCSAKDKCTGTDQCCGTATPKLNAPGVTTGQQTGVCASKTDKGFTDGLNIEFTHVCGAQNLVAAAGALFASAYLM